MPRTRAPADVEAVLELKAAGYTDREVCGRTGVPINTIRLWRNRGLSRHAKRALRVDGLCRACGCDPHDFASLPLETYAYLLAVYLGDGCLGRNRTSWTLRIALDVVYPGIVEACCDAIERIRGDRRPRPRIDR
jgi:hypothetical protein